MVILFVPPVEKVYLSTTDPFFKRVPYYVGTTVFKEDGVYRQVRGEYPPEDVDNADVVYLGGHEYEITDEEAADLTAAGYAVYISYAGYGSGLYGAGFYGIPQGGS